MLTVILLCSLYIFNIIGLRLFRVACLRWHILVDYPNRRNSHETPTIRGAGVVFVLSTLLFWIALEHNLKTLYMQNFIVAGLLLAAVSIIDDYKRLPIRLRLLVHILAALIFLSALPIPSLFKEYLGNYAFIWFPLSAFFITASINLYNFMDGIDGMAGLHSICVLIGWLTLSFVFQGDINIWMMSLLLPLIAFIQSNWNPAKVFMGDVGSTFLGFTFSCLAVSQLHGAPRLLHFLTFILLMMPFLFDTSFTLLCRCMKGNTILRPHKDFLFHRLVTSGYSHKTVSTAYALLTLYNIVLLYSIISSYIGIVFGLPLIILPYMFLYTWSVHSTITQNESKIIATQSS